MNSKRDKGFQWTRSWAGVAGAALLLLSSVFAVSQQTGGAPRPDPEYVQEVFHLNFLGQSQDLNEVNNTLRNLLPASTKVFPLPNQNGIIVGGTPEQLALARKVMAELERPSKSYRLTYTIIESDSGKRIGAQHFAMVAIAGQRALLKQGSKVPVVTGSSKGAPSTDSTQVQYLDVGINIDATLDEFANGLRLRTKVEQSSVAEERSGVGSQDPVIRQTLLEGTSFLTLGKPVMLGALDIQGSTRHLDVEVVLEQVK
ncbi:MAG: hypothetical protein JWM43_2782 [Acidobacteriaceae bacterium]|nr:hypothetical protein [Acidobacteriaceae bacterium]